MGAIPTLSGQQVHDQGLADWRLLLHAIHARFRTGGFAAGLALVNRIGEAAEAADHHPDLDLRYGHLDVALSSHDAGGITDRDIALARRISELAAEAGIGADPDAVSEVELALDTADQAAVAPFWKAVLGMQDSPTVDEDIVDPSGRLPTMWFQATTAHDEPRQRFHLDVHVPHDVAEQRRAAALAAGGTLVSDAAAPSFWVLADVEGNKACICTWQGRG